MGIYLNPGNEQFAVSVNSELYVDKTELIKYTNSHIGKDRPLICSSQQLCALAALSVHAPCSLSACVHNDTCTVLFTGICVREGMEEQV